MENLFDGALFALLVGAAGLGIASLITALLPPADESDSDEPHAGLRNRTESIFFGIGGLVIALVAWAGIIL